MHRRREIAHPLLTRFFQKLSPDTAMLFTPFGCTHPPPPVLHLLRMQNLSPKHCWNWHYEANTFMKGFVSLAVKGLTLCLWSSPRGWFLRGRKPFYIRWSPDPRQQRIWIWAIKGLVVHCSRLMPPRPPSCTQCTNKPSRKKDMGRTPRKPSHSCTNLSSICSTTTMCILLCHFHPEWQLVPITKWHHHIQPKQQHTSQAWKFWWSVQ